MVNAMYLTLGIEIVVWSLCLCFCFVTVTLFCQTYLVTSVQSCVTFFHMISLCLLLFCHSYFVLSHLLGYLDLLNLLLLLLYYLSVFASVSQHPWSTSANEEILFSLFWWGYCFINSFLLSKKNRHADWWGQGCTSLTQVQNCCKLIQKPILLRLFGCNLHLNL